MITRSSSLAVFFLAFIGTAFANELRDVTFSADFNANEMPPLSDGKPLKVIN